MSHILDKISQHHNAAQSGLKIRYNIFDEKLVPFNANRIFFCKLECFLLNLPEN